MEAAAVRPKPLLRGWLHAAAAIAAVALTVALCLQTADDPPRLVSMLVFGLSNVELYTVSALYHIGRWGPRSRRIIRRLDHANIAVLIAGTYTALCFNVLSGWWRVAILAIIWALAVVGVVVPLVTLELPRQLVAALYIAMGWIALLVLPELGGALGLLPVGLLLLGGLLYTIGGLVYARRRPDPFPRVLGFHEIFHLFVIAGGAVFALVVWVWVVPYPRA